MKSLAKLLSAGTALLACAVPAAAQPVAPGTDEEVTARIAYLQGALDDGRHTARLWSWGWAAGYGAATAAQLAARSSSGSEKQRQDLAVGAATTLLGVVGLAVFPVEAGEFPDRLRGLPADTPEARRAKLGEAERSLRKAAAQEAAGRSWKTHAAAAAVNLAAGLAIWKHYDRPAEDGLITFAVGQLISEAQIFTQPTRAIRALRDYESRTDFATTITTAHPRPDWYVGAGPASVVVGVRF
jgi:hypothetical protein